MVLLDSDFLIAYIRNKPEAVAKMIELRRLGVQLTTTPINVYELFHGCYHSTRREKNLDKVRGLLSVINRLPLDDESCEEAGRIISELEARGTPIGGLDSIIAGVALRHGEAIITRNYDHYSKVDGLAIEPW